MIYIILEVVLSVVGTSTVVWGYQEYKKDPEEFFGVK